MFRVITCRPVIQLTAGVKCLDGSPESVPEGPLIRGSWVSDNWGSPPSESGSIEALVLTDDSLH